MATRIYTDEIIRKAIRLHKSGFSYATINQHLNNFGDPMSLADACRRYERRQKNKNQNAEK